MTSVADVIAVLVTGLDRLRLARDRVAAAAASLARARAGLVAADTGSADARLDAAASLLTQAITRLQRVDTVTAGGGEAVTAYVTAIGAVALSVRRVH